ncbi:transmembrane protein 174 [Chanos chanos]|uniref:Transmembrane protein 174 n=1 Tax=Chanos chanos TaxID=29144 RepID=A0A6J2WD14_CHACN|nr:transmembrane protein 174 [Chanos chanos]
MTGRQIGGSTAAVESTSTPSAVATRIPGGRLNHDDFSVNVVSVVPHQPMSRTDSQVSDRDKAGATLLFSGIFLGLVGMTFTAMGWVNYDINQSFEWTQLLGPILLSVGGTFILISVCKFRMLSCQGCHQQRQEDVEADMDMSPAAPGQAFVFTGINQPIAFHRATVVQYIPPPYASVTQDCNPGPVNAYPQNSLDIGRSPQYYRVYRTENSISLCDGDSPQNFTAEQRESRIRGQTVVRMEATDSFSLPSYEELYPTPPSTNST